MAATTPWKELSTHSGTGSMIPRWINALARGDWDDRFDRALLGAGDGDWCQASARTVDVLLGRLGDTDHPDDVLDTATRMAAANHTRAWLSPAEGYLPADVEEVVLAHTATVAGLLSHEAANVRVPATMFLTLVPPEGRDAVVPLLARAARDDVNELVRAGALLALGRFDETDEIADLLTASLDDAGAPVVVRGAAALALLRARPDRPLEEIAAGIFAWMAWSRVTGRKDDTYYWFGLAVSEEEPSAWSGDWHLATAKALLDVAGPLGRAEDVVRLLLDRPGLEEIVREDPVVRATTGRLVREYYGFHSLRYDGAALLEELTPEQVEVARRFADSELIFETGYGLPAAGPARRRWLGIDPPGPMERLVDVVIDGGPAVRPLWWTCANWRGGARIPEQVLALTGADRWEVLVQHAGELYHRFDNVFIENLDEELASAVADPRLGEVVLPVLEALITHRDRLDRTDRERWYRWGHSMLCLAAATRTVGQLPEGWRGILSPYLTAGCAREITEQMPEEYREWYFEENEQTHGVLLRVLDLIPSAAPLTTALVSIAKDRRDGVELERGSIALEERIRALAPTTPLLAQALADAEADDL